MTLVDLLLSSRASAPEHCRECDGPRDLPGRDCSECVDAGLWQRLEWRYQNDEGVTPLGDYGPLRVTREFHPLRWMLAVDVWIDWPEPGLALSVGPWSLILERAL